MAYNTYCDQYSHPNPYIIRACEPASCSKQFAPHIHPHAEQQTCYVFNVNAYTYTPEYILLLYEHTYTPTATTTTKSHNDYAFRLSDRVNFFDQDTGGLFFFRNKLSLKKIRLCGDTLFWEDRIRLVFWSFGHPQIIITDFFINLNSSTDLFILFRKYSLLILIYTQ